MFVGVFAVYAFTASPGFGWLDSPEFVAAGASLGVAHSPGHPLAGLLGRAATLVPFGDMAWRIALLSSVCGALAAVAVWAAAREVVARALPEPQTLVRDVLAVGAALVFSLSWAAWFQGVRAEVYALAGALCTGVTASILAYDRTTRARYLLVAGLLAGLALAQHHLIALLVIAPVAVFVLASKSRRPAPAIAGATALLGMVGLASLLYLPARASASAEVNWGDPDTFERFAWTVSAKAFQKSAGADHVSSAGQDTAEVIAAVFVHATPILLFGALLGLYLAVRTRGGAGVGLLFAAIAAAGVAGRVLIGFDPETPDHHAYLLPAIAAVILLGVYGLASIVRVVDQRAMTLGIAIVVAALVPWQLARNLSESSLRTAYASSAMARAEIEPLPPRALVLVSYFQTSFRLWAERTVDDARPDVVVLDRSFMTYPGFAQDTRARHPDMAALIDAPLRAGAPTPLGLLRPLAASRAVMVQLHINLDAAPFGFLAPAGVYARMSPTPWTPAERTAAEADDELARDRLGDWLDADADGDIAGARDALVWHDFMRLQFYCAIERKRAASDALARAAATATADETLAAVAQACGITAP